MRRYFCFFFFFFLFVRFEPFAVDPHWHRVRHNTKRLFFFVAYSFRCHSNALLFGILIEDCQLWGHHKVVPSYKTTAARIFTVFHSIRFFNFSIYLFLWLVFCSPSKWVDVSRTAPLNGGMRLRTVHIFTAEFMWFCNGIEIGGQCESYARLHAHFTCRKEQKLN